MAPVGENRNQPGAGVLANHVEFVGPQHRQRERLGEDQQPPRLHQLPHGLCPGIVPAVPAHQHGIAAAGIEQSLPAHPAGRLCPGPIMVQAGQMGRVIGKIADEDDRVAATVRSLHHPCDLLVNTEDTEFHLCNWSPQRGK